MFVGRAGIGSLIASADCQEFCQPPLDPSQSLMACNGPGPPGVRRMALRLRDGKCSITSVADPAPIEGLEVLRHVENGDVEDVIWERAALSRIILSDEFCSLDDAEALKRGKAFGHAADPQSLKQNYGRGAPALCHLAALACLAATRVPHSQGR